MVTFAVASSRSDIEALTDFGFGAMLISYANDQRGTLLDGLDPSVKVMIDSGAFTAWTTGKQVDLEAFAGYAAAQLARCPGAVVVNLDVIPGTATAPHVSWAEQAAAVAASADNAERLRDLGLPVMEVYHLGEPLQVLDDILVRLRPGERLALGGLARQKGGLGFPVKQRFCQAAFAHLKERFGWQQLPPVHGLGIAPDGPIGGARFPWASVDCSSWGSISHYGVKVTASGKRLGGRTDTRVSNPKLASVYRRRVLARWQRYDVQYGAMWAARGVAA